MISRRYSIGLLLLALLALSFVQTAPSNAQAAVIDFNNLTATGQPLTGIYPIGVADWGANQWTLSGPWGSFSTNSVSFPWAATTFAAFTFVTPAVLTSVDVYNGGTNPTTITLSCSGNPNITQPVTNGQSMTINTNWTVLCTSVTVGSSTGWWANFDNFAYTTSGQNPGSEPTPPPNGTPTATTWNGHTAMVDSSGKLLSWLPQATAYKDVIDLAWGYIKTSVPSPGGVKHYLRYCCYVYPPNGTEYNWFNNPAGNFAMFVDSLIASYPYTGDASLIPIVKEMLDYMLANGTTPANWNWASVPFASSQNGDLVYNGDRNADRDGINGIEPDKVGELGHAYLKFWQLTGDTTYRTAAINAANALASHVRTGNANQSPWPFRVDGQTGAIREEYTANMVGPVKLLDEMIRLNIGNVASYQTARSTAWNWVLTYPMQNNRWVNYFEDMPRDPGFTNINQLTPLETARYILSHNNPATVDPNWQTNVPALLNWVVTTFGRGPYFGAQAINEQTGCCSQFGLGSHTARWASINAMMYERTGTATYLENAYRALNYATYHANEDGVVLYSFNTANVWYTDGYGDFIKHFMGAMGAVPEWSPTGENHLIRSTSVVTSVDYDTPTEVRFTTFDSGSREVLKLAFEPTSVTVDGAALPERADLNQPGWVFNATTGVLRIRHDTGRAVIVNTDAVPDPPAATPELNVIDSTTYELTWSGVSWAVAYEIQVDTDKQFDEPFVAHNAGLAGDQRSFSVSGLHDDTSYYWRVRGQNRNGEWGSWTPTQSFVVDLP